MAFAKIERIIGAGLLEISVYIHIWNSSLDSSRKEIQ